MATLTEKNHAKVISSAAKGWNTRYSPATMPEEYAEVFDNVLIDQDGNVEKRNGYERLNATAIPGNARPLGYGELVTAGGTRTVVFNTDDGKIYKLNSDNSVTEIGSGLVANKRCYFAAMNDLLIISNGVNAPQKWDGTAPVSALGGTPPTFKFAVTHNGRLWTAGFSDNGMRVHASALADPETWTVPATVVATSPFRIELKYVASSADQILSLTAYKEHLVIFCSDNILIYATDEDATLVALNVNIPNRGAIAPAVTLNVGRDIIFWSKFGVKTIATAIGDGRLEPHTDLSENIDNYLADRYEFCRVNGLTDFITMDHAPDQSWFMLNYPTDAGATKFEQAIVHYGYKSWFRWTGIYTAALFVSSTNIIYGGEAGYVLKLNSGDSDNGAAINYRWKTPNLYLGNSVQNKHLRYLTLIVKHSVAFDLDVIILYDFSTKGSRIFRKTIHFDVTGSLYRESYYRVDLYRGAGRQKKRFQVRGKGLTCQFFFENSQANQKFTIELVRPEYMIGGIN